MEDHLSQDKDLGSREYDYENNEIEKTKSYINRYNNPSKEKEYFSSSVYTKQLEISLDDAILDPQSLFKPFIINFDSENYQYLNKTYSLKGYFYKFDRISNTNGSSEFNVNTVLELIEV